jgi:integrase
MSVRKREWKTRKGETKQAWIVDYTDQHGKRHIETYQRKKDADAQEAKVLVDIGKGVHVAPSDSITVAEAAQQWIARVKAEGREPTTLQGYEQHVRAYIVPHIGRVKLAKLTALTVEGFRNQLLKQVEEGDQRPADAEGGKKRPLSRATARKVFTSFKMLLKSVKFAHVAADVTIAASKRERRLEPGLDFPETSEIKRLLAAATTERQRALLLAAALTGLRASELRGLRWSDVDLKVGELHVRQRADRFGSIGAPKSKAGSRTIPLAPELVSALKAWKLACPISAAGLVFPSRTGRIEHLPTLLGVLESVMRDAGVVERSTGKPKYAMHAFRHFFASWCINPKERGGRELPPKVVQHLLGHSSIVMTLDVYGHLFRDGGDRAELAEASAALLG